MQGLNRLAIKILEDGFEEQFSELNAPEKMLNSSNEEF